MPFWTKQPLTQIEILEDPPSVDERALLLETRTRPRREASLSELSASALDRLLEAEAERGTQATRTVLATTLESKDVAVETAESLARQTRQLENVAGLLDDTHANLDHVDVTVRKLTRSKLRRAAEKPFTALKRGNKIAQTQKRAKPAKRKSEDAETVVVGEALQRRDSFSDFENVAVRRHLQTQDEHLMETGQQLEELHRLALGIGQEIEYEAEIVEGIDAPAVTARIRVNHARLRTGLRV